MAFIVQGIGTLGFVFMRIGDIEKVLADTEKSLKVAPE